MTTAVSTRKPMWSVAEWEAFGIRCQAARDALHAVYSTFPETRGLKPAMINCLMRAHDQLKAGMLKAESLFVRQHPDQNPRAIAVIHGKGGTVLAPCRGRVRKDAPLLTREQWSEWGRRMKALRRAIADLGLELQETALMTKPDVRPFFKAADLGLSRTWMDSLVCRQHPDWPEATKVFYGPDELDDDF